MNRDYFCLAAAVVICVVLFAAFPVNYVPFRNQFFKFFFNKTEYSQKANLIVTSLTVLWS